MYLGNRNVKAKSYISGFTAQDYKRIDAVRLNSLVVRLRSGDKSVTEEIILGHLGLTLHIVGRYVRYFPCKTDDLVGVAMCTLTEAVDKFSSVAKNDEITPWLVTTIHGQLSNYIKQDRTVRITLHTWKKIISDPELNLPCENNFESVSKTNIDETDIECSKALEERMSYRDDLSGLEIKEILDKINFTRFEGLVLRYLLDGWTEAQIATHMKYTRGMINHVKKDVHKKLFPYFVEQLIATAKINGGVNNV